MSPDDAAPAAGDPHTADAGPGPAISLPHGDADGESATLPDRPPPPARSLRFEAGDFIVRLYRKIEQDNIFFLAGAIAFNIVIAVVPLILASLGIAGLLLQSRYGASAADQIVRFVTRALPPLTDQVLIWFRTTLDELIAGSTGYVGLGTLVLAWIATRMIGTLRTALREIFDLHQDRGIVQGKLFDMGMVAAAGTLLAFNVGLTLVLQVVGNLGVSVLGIDAARFQVLHTLVLNMLAFLSIWFMFALIYRYLPARRPAWRIAIISATFTSILFEGLKTAFGWYVTNVASYTSAYGNFATLIIFLLWIYYVALAFVIGGEVGQVAALRRIRRNQKERLV